MTSWGSCLLKKLAWGYFGVKLTTHNSWETSGILWYSLRHLWDTFGTPLYLLYLHLRNTQKHLSSFIYFFPRQIFLGLCPGGKPLLWLLFFGSFLFPHRSTSSFLRAKGLMALWIEIKAHPINHIKLKSLKNLHLGNSKIHITARCFLSTLETQIAQVL